MTVSLPVKKSLERMRRGLAWACLLLVVAAAALALVMPGRPWLSAGLGLLTGIVMFAVSSFTTAKMARSEIPSVGWVALDYVVKIALVAGALISAKYVEVLNLHVVAALVIGSVLANMAIQVWAFSSSTGVASNDSDH